MRLMEDERDLLERGRQMGREEGREEGRKEGIHQGIEALILDNIEADVSKERIVEKLIRHFEISDKEAEKYYTQFVPHQ